MKKLAGVLIFFALSQGVGAQINSGRPFPIVLQERMDAANLMRSRAENLRNANMANYAILKDLLNQSAPVFQIQIARENILLSQQDMIRAIANLNTVIGQCDGRARALGKYLTAEHKAKYAAWGKMMQEAVERFKPPKDYGDIMREADKIILRSPRQPDVKMHRAKTQTRAPSISGAFLFLTSKR